MYDFLIKCTYIFLKQVFKLFDLALKSLDRVLQILLLQYLWKDTWSHMNTEFKY